MLASPVKYHYSHRFFTYSVSRETGVPPDRPISGAKQSASCRLRPAPKTASGGEFDWGGTSVKW